MSDNPPIGAPAPDFDIGQWLESLPRGQSAEASAENDISVETLAQITSEGRETADFQTGRAGSAFNAGTACDASSADPE